LIAVDTNVLVYAHREDAAFHETASARIAELAEGTAIWAIPWPCIHEFLNVVTHPRIYTVPTPLPRALEQVDIWLESPTLVLLAETATHWPTLRTMLLAGRVIGPRVHDGRVAALCRQHGVRELWTADRDFSRFGAVPTVNPLVGR
jgi:toxin-antitoxin system PIN domain toxin